MKVILVLVSFLLLVAPAAAQEPSAGGPLCPTVPAEAPTDTPQTAAWFDQVAFGGCRPFPEVVQLLDAQWDSTAGPSGQPFFGGTLTGGSCGQTSFRKDDVFWGGYFNPSQPLPTGMVALVTDGWVGAFQVTVDGFSIPETVACGGGRWLRPVTVTLLPLVQRAN